ncbi:hypothetical protein N9023_04160 [Opitutaceae bacterium]|nr:hypothetical protein [Opitutaceae bacterium]
MTTKTNTTGILPLDQPEGVDFTLQEFPIPAKWAKSVFEMVDPLPHRFKIRYGYSRADYEGNLVLSFHPDSDLWIKPRKQSGTMKWRYGMLDATWNRDGGKSDGVDFGVFVESPDGARREIFKDVVTPLTEDSKRGILTGEFAFEIGPEDTLVFCSRPRGNAAFDWAFVVDINEQ